jgi:hypothetical protein
MSSTFETTFSITFAIGLVLSLLGIVMIPIYKSIFADGKVEYCYIISNQNSANPNFEGTYDLHGHRPWRNDRTLAINLKSVDTAKSVAESLHCEIH